MKIITINKKEWDAGLKKSQSTYRLIGPVKEPNHSYAQFKEVKDTQAIDIALNNTRLSPKSIVFPPSEVMFTYTTDTNSEEANLLKSPSTDYTKTAVIGIQPMDAASFLLVKKNYDTKEYRDPYWCDAYASCTFVGLANNKPTPVDFSTSTKSGPFDETGLDVLLVDNGDQYLAKVITEKGQDYMNQAGWTTEADKSADDTISKLKIAAEQQISSKIAFDNIQKQSIMDLYEADFWEDLAFACINCGTCTYLCPTCWCFDIQDENQGKIGHRQKNWDSCMYPLFTLHGTGHNPRTNKTMRVRQRFMHKLKYFMDKYDDGIMCVGCGRCIQYCPVNIDIRKICQVMNDYKPS